MRYFALIACIVLAGGVLPGALLDARAEGALQGTYEFDPKRSDDVTAVIQGAVNEMSFLLRPIARSRLRKASALYQKIVIGQTAALVEVVFDHAAPLRMPADGTPVTWKHDGETLQVSGGWQGARLVQSFQAEDGRRVNTYALSEDGEQLHIDVVLTSPRMQDPVKYSLVYRRAKAL